MDIVLIPAYEPEEQMIPLARQLKENGFAVVIVDDGSGPAFRDVFDAAAEFAHILVHEKNRGKGAALKTGMAYIRDHMPEGKYFITCDADGQHRVEDVVRVREQLHAGHKFVLTMRKQRKGIPLRSKVGNTLSRVVYALLTKRFLADNQSGLRGFHRSHIDWMIQVEKDNYDYEMNVLYYAAKKAVPISTMLIEAIYINNNQSSHFQPVKDTVRIYRSLFKLAIGLPISFLAAEAWVVAASLICDYQHLLTTVPSTGILSYLVNVLITVPSAGILSYLVNVLISRFAVFRTTRCHDYLTLLIHQVISYVLYTLGCLLFFYACPQIPMWAAFNIVFFVCLPLRYWLYKFTAIAQRTLEDVAVTK